MLIAIADWDWSCMNDDAADGDVSNPGRRSASVLWGPILECDDDCCFDWGGS